MTAAFDALKTALDDNAAKTAQLVAVAAQIAGAPAGTSDSDIETLTTMVQANNAAIDTALSKLPAPVPAT